MSICQAVLTQFFFILTGIIRRAKTSWTDSTLLVGGTLSIAHAKGGMYVVYVGAFLVSACGLFALFFLDIHIKKLGLTEEGGGIG